MEWFNNDQREMEEFVASNNLDLPASPEQHVAPSLATGSTTAPVDLPSLASIDEYGISVMEPISQRAGKGKVAVAVDNDSRLKKYRPKETLFLAKNFIDVSEDPLIGNHFGSTRTAFRRRFRSGMEVERSLKFSEGAEPVGSGAPKRTKVFAFGNYSTSDGGPTIDLNITDEDPDWSSSDTQSCLMGTAANQSTMSVPPPNFRKIRCLTL
ncbi:hypothetical protein AAHA92_10457 [Salvia divinorum]|uniref:Uncharacterized protein n=1 Tax=Salvia divinorum TaxID=28513 RepID=A0ABD1HYU1_SALDI